MGQSLTSFAVLFAPALMLHGIKEPPILKHDCVRAAVKHFGLNGEPFERIFALRETGGRAASEAEAHELFASYLAQIEIVTEAVDELRLSAEK
jgi:hypothetical protein